MPINDRDEDGRHIEDRWLTPGGYNPFLFKDVPIEELDKMGWELAFPEIYERLPDGTLIIKPLSR